MTRQSDRGIRFFEHTQTRSFLQISRFHGSTVSKGCRWLKTIPWHTDNYFKTVCRHTWHEMTILQELKCCKKSRTFYINKYIFLFCQTFLFSCTWHLATSHDFAHFESIHFSRVFHTMIYVLERCSLDWMIWFHYIFSMKTEP